MIVWLQIIHWEEFMENTENTETLELLRAIKSADEAGKRVSDLIKVLQEKKESIPKEGYAAKLGVYVCRAVLHKQFIDPNLPNFKNKNRKAAALAFVDYVKDDPSLKEFDQKELETFFFEFGVPNVSQNQLLFNSVWFENISEQFRLSLHFHKTKTDNFDWSAENEEDDNS